MSKLNILIAYPYFKNNIFNLLKQRITELNDIRLIIDSGAFTAWNTGKKIELDDYCKFLDKIQDLHPFKAVQLDVFGDPEKSYKNFLIMKDRGYDVMPVFTRGESLERLEELYKHTDYIMFGGIVIGGKNKNYAKWFLERNKGRKCHWLGFVKMDFIKKYKPESVDSSSWLSGGRFGNLGLYAGNGNLATVSKKVFAQKLPNNIISLLHRNGVSDAEIHYLTHNQAWVGSGNYNPKNGLKSLAMMICTMGNVIRGIDVEKKIGTKIYLAVANSNLMEMIFQAKDTLITRGVLRE